MTCTFGWRKSLCLTRWAVRQYNIGQYSQQHSVACCELLHSLHRSCCMCEDLLIAYIAYNRHTVRYESISFCFASKRIC
jgi:hypothetical protein